MAEGINNVLPENHFVCRMMCAKCSYGSMSHPLNVPELQGGHGVLFGAEEQPVLNANDWKPDINVIHFGDCYPRNQDENGNIIKESGFNKFLSDAGAFFFSKKCIPMIEKVWYETETKYLIDGAPVLLVKSLLFCKRGGIITIEQPTFEDGADENNVPDLPMEVLEEQVDATVDRALANQQIDAATAEFMKDGYKEALAFTCGDVDAANALFNDLVRLDGRSAEEGSFEYASSESQLKKFQMFLEHKNVTLNTQGVSQMELTSNTGPDISLGDAAQTIHLNERRIAETPYKQPTLSGYIDAVHQQEMMRYASYDAYGEMQYSPDMPQRLTAPPDPNNAFYFMNERSVPEHFQGANVSETAVRIADMAAPSTDTPSVPVVVSILKGLDQ